jgi:hypothetical protein
MRSERLLGVIFIFVLAIVVFGVPKSRLQCSRRASRTAKPRSNTDTFPGANHPRQCELGDRRRARHGPEKPTIEGLKVKDSSIYEDGQRQEIASSLPRNNPLAWQSY